MRHDKIMTSRLPITHAFHSPLLTPACEGLIDALRAADLRAPRIRWISNLTGTWIRDEEATSPEYWAAHMCRTVRFAAGVGELLKDNARVLVEVGAGQSLCAFVRQHPAYGGDEPKAGVPTMRAAYQAQTDGEFLLGALAQLWLAGVEPDWEAFYDGKYRRQKLPLPA
jgi:acyl transferase domain-containing protein